MSNEINKENEKKNDKLSMNDNLKEENSDKNSNQKNIPISRTESESEIISHKNSLNQNNNGNINKININPDINLENDYEILTDYKDNADLIFKAIMIGDPYVGKSSLINKAIKNRFESAYNPTVGFDYYIFNIKIKNKIIKLQIWDTCGQEIYHSLVTNFYRNSSFAFIVYAINDKTTFENIDNWLREIKYQSNPDTKIFLIGNKCDLIDERQVTYIEGEIFCKNFGFNGFYEVSAKTGEKAEEILVSAAKILFNDYSDYKNDTKIRKNTYKEIDLKSDDKSKSYVSLDRGNSHSNCC